MPTKAHACQNICQPLTPAKAFAFLDTDHDGLVSVDEIAAQMQSVMRVTVPADEIRSICKVSLSKNPKGLTMEDFTFLVCTLPTLSTPQFCSECARRCRCIGNPLWRRERLFRTTRPRNHQVTAAAVASFGPAFVTPILRKQRYR